MGPSLRELTEWTRRLCLGSIILAFLWLALSMQNPSLIRAVAEQADLLDINTATAEQLKATGIVDTYSDSSEGHL